MSLFTKWYGFLSGEMAVKLPCLEILICFFGLKLSIIVKFVPSKVNLANYTFRSLILHKMTIWFTILLLWHLFTQGIIILRCFSPVKGANGMDVNHFFLICAIKWAEPEYESVPLQITVSVFHVKWQNWKNYLFQ